MRKVLKYLLIIILLVIVGFITYIFVFSPPENYNSFYLVPDDAAFIVESDNPFKAWDGIVKNKSWNHLRTNKSLASIDSAILKADSLISSNKLLFKMLSSRKVLISAHECKPNKYDFLIVVDLKKISKFKKLQDHLGRILGKNFVLSKREYNGHDILELLDKEGEEYYYFSFIENQIALSTKHNLVEASIDQTDKKIIGRDLNFREISKRISGKGLFNIYIHFRYFDDYLTSLLGQKNDFVNMLGSSLDYSGFTFNIDDEGNLDMQGYINTVDSVYSFFTAFLESGNGPKDIFEIIPQRTASYIGIGFNDIEEFHSNIEKYMQETGVYNSYKSSMNRVEKKLKISVEENFLGWIDKEMAILQTQPSNLGRDNEFAVIFKAKSKRAARKNLGFIIEQVKKKSPVKFKTVEYKDYEIRYLHIPGIFKVLFGKLIQRLEKPYFTIIKNYVVFSNHPQTIKSIIDDFENGEVISKNENTKKFEKQFSNKQNIFLFSQPPVLFENLKNFLSTESWNNLKNNKEYITCFPHAGFQLDNTGDIFKISLKIQYNEQQESFNPFEYIFDPFSFFETDTSFVEQTADELEESLIIIDDVNATKHTEYHENGSLKLSVGVKEGFLHGSFREYYDNGVLKIKGKYKNDVKDGNWKYYNSKGKEMKSENYKDGELMKMDDSKQILDEEKTKYESELVSLISEYNSLMAKFPELKDEFSHEQQNIQRILRTEGTDAYKVKIYKKEFPVLIERINTYKQDSITIE